MRITAARLAELLEKATRRFVDASGTDILTKEALEATDQLGLVAVDLAADLANARAEIERLRATEKARADHSTHFEGCWRYHLGCAVAEVERLDGGLQRLAVEARWLCKQSSPVDKQGLCRVNAKLIAKLAEAIADTGIEP